MNRQVGECPEEKKRIQMTNWTRAVKFWDLF